MEPTEDKKKSKNPSLAKQLLMGITKVSLTTSSFYQPLHSKKRRACCCGCLRKQRRQTKRIKRKRYYCRLIPAGTGIKKANSHYPLVTSVGFFPSTWIFVNLIYYQKFALLIILSFFRYPTPNKVVVWGLYSPNTGFWIQGSNFRSISKATCGELVEYLGRFLNLPVL